MLNKKKKLKFLDYFITTSGSLFFENIIFETISLKKRLIDLNNKYDSLSSTHFFRE